MEVNQNSLIDVLKSSFKEAWSEVDPVKSIVDFLFFIFGLSVFLIVAILAIKFLSFPIFLVISAVGGYSVFFCDSCADRRKKGMKSFRDFF